MGSRAYFLNILCPNDKASALGLAVVAWGHLKSNRKNITVQQFNLRSSLTPLRIALVLRAHVPKENKDGNSCLLRISEANFNSAVLTRPKEGRFSCSHMSITAGVRRRMCAADGPGLWKRSPLIRVNKGNAEWFAVGGSAGSRPSLTLPDVTRCCFATNVRSQETRRNPSADNLTLVIGSANDDSRATG